MDQQLELRFRSRPKLIEIDIKNGFSKVSGKLTTISSKYLSEEKITIPLNKNYLLGIIINIMLSLEIQVINSYNEQLSLPIEDIDISEDIETVEYIEIKIENKTTKKLIEVFPLKPPEPIMIENNEFYPSNSESIVIIKGEKYSVFMASGLAEFQLISKTNMKC